MAAAKNTKTQSKSPTNRRTPDPKDERREGSRLAIVMLRELEASPELCDECCLHEPPAAQDNIVLRYLDTCRRVGRDTEAGFCAVLSDFVADSSNGFSADAASYQSALKIRVPGSVSAEARRRRTWKAAQRIIGEDNPMPSNWMK